MASFGTRLQKYRVASDSSTMPGYLLHWDLRESLSSDAVVTQNGEEVRKSWRIGNKTSLSEGDRIFMLAQKGHKIRPKLANGLIGSGYVGPAPEGETPITPGSAIFHSEDRYDGHERTIKKGNRITAVWEAILRPDQILTVDRLEKSGNLKDVYWNPVSSGNEIKPKKGSSQVDVLPELEELWRRHLEEIAFPVEQLKNASLPMDEEEMAATRRFGPEGKIKFQIHKQRERNNNLRRAKKDEAQRLCGKLECEVCQFVFTDGYGDHGSGFIECHHREALLTLDPKAGRIPTLADLALVCANCHRMLHRKDWPSIPELRSRLSG